MNPPLTLLQAGLPEGVPVPVRWLHRLGISSAAVHAQVRGGWLLPLPGRAYLRPGPPLTWPAVLYGAQQTGVPVHVGHLSALALHGLAHYLPLGGQETLHLYLPGRVPTWLTQLPASVRWHHEIVLREDDPAPFHPPDTLRQASPDVPAARLLGVAAAPRLPWTVFASTPERAAVEMAAGLTHGDSWDTAYEVFGGLTTLRPALVRRLLGACASRVTRRIFLHLARESGHAWLGALDLDGLDLGRGDRQVVPGGRLDPVYRITVPGREDALGL